MKLNSKLIASGLITAVTCALVGSITGTFAWYGYSTRATAALTGTSIDKAANLQIGIVEANASGEVATSLSNLEKDGDIYWSPVGGGLNQNIIEGYLGAKGYSRKEMRPTTSGKLTNDGVKANPNYDPKQLISEDNYPFLKEIQDIQPKEMSLYQYNLGADADKSDYVVLPLALRVSDLKNNHLKGTSIYVSDFSFDVLNDKNTDIGKAMRVDFKTWNNNDNVEHKLVSPKATADGKVELGGLLDLNKDGYVDVEETDYGYRERHELVYGAVKDEQYQEYKNIENPLYYADKEEKTDGAYIRLNDAGKTLVEGNDLPAGTYYSQYLYNKVEEQNEPVKYELAYSLQDANSVEYTKKGVANPFLDSEVDYGNGKGFVVYGADKKIAAKMGAIDSYIAVVDEDNNVSMVAIPDGQDFNEQDFDSSKLYKLNSVNKYYVAGENQYYHADDHANYCYYQTEDGFGTCLLVDDVNELANHYAVEVSNNNFELKQKSAEEAVDDDNDYDFKKLYVDNPEYHNGHDIDADHQSRAHKYIEKVVDALYEVNDAVPATYERKIHYTSEGAVKYHQQNTYTVESYEAFEQKYICVNNFKSDFDSKGWLIEANAHEVCNTGDEALVYCTLTMWIEGWDENCNDSVLGVEYGLGIQFQVNRVDVKA